MSRCFPFPPPGYEKKPRTDDTDLLKKEKNKEKKHKKDKRDNEKKEGKEKREKDRSDGKHREKKDRKEKNREKKKDKEKDRDKDRDKSSISEEKRVGGRDSYNGEKIHPREELDKEKNGSSDQKKAAMLFQGQHGEKPVQNSSVLQETEDPKFVQELARRIRSDEKGAGSSQLVERSDILGQRKDDAVDRLSSVRDTGMLSEGKKKEKRVDSRKMDDQKIWDEPSVGGNAMAAKLSGTVQKRFEGTTPLDKKPEKKTEEKEKSRNKDGDERRGDKRKNKDREKQSQGMEKDKEKEKKKEEKAKEKSERKKAERERAKLSNKSDIISAPNHISLQPSNSGKTSVSEGNLKKRKEMETNGFSHNELFHDNEFRPNKMARLDAHPMSENGRKLESHQSPGLVVLDRQEPLPNKLKADIKEHKLNGLTASSTVSSSKPKLPSTSSPYHGAQSLSVSMSKPSPSTIMTVSTAKPSSASTDRNAAPMIPVSAVKSSSSSAIEIAAPMIPVAAEKPSTASANAVAAEKKSILTTKPSGITRENAAQVASVSTKKPPSATNSQIAKVSMKPPHPDTKHLSQILTVPKMEDWSDFDDQEWLFGSKDAQLKNPEVPSVGADEELQVWAEALKIESVDLYALPYVVPY